MQSSGLSKTDDPIHASLKAELVCADLQQHQSELIDDTFSQAELQKLEKSDFFQEMFETAHQLDAILREKSGLTKYLMAEASGNNDAPWRDKKKRMYRQLAQRSTNSCLQTVEVLSVLHRQLSNMITLAQAEKIYSVDIESVRIRNQQRQDQIVDRPSKKAIQQNLVRFMDTCQSVDIDIPDSMVAIADGGYTMDEVIQLTRRQPSSNTGQNENPLMCKYTRRLQKMVENTNDMSPHIDHVECEGCVLTRHCDKLGLT